MLYSAVLLFAPRTKKTHQRIFKKGNRTIVLSSVAHDKWFEAAVMQARLARRGQPPIAEMVHVRALFYRDANRGDWCGYAQALGDLLQAKRGGAGVIEDDVQIRSWDQSRLLVDRARPRIEVQIYSFVDAYTG